MKKITLLFCFLCVAYACKTVQSTVIVVPQTPGISHLPKDTTAVTPSPAEVAGTLPEPGNAALTKEAVIKTALSYNGTPYRYAGTTREGMDCSGLVYTAFKEHQVTLERSSHLMAVQGKEISVSEINRGDLVFFITNGGSRINHVGLVVTVANSEISFIHATTSRGVLLSSLKEPYWNANFVKARRIFFE